MDLTNKKILVVGSTNELGTEISSKLSSLGATLALIDYQDPPPSCNISNSVTYTFDLYNNKGIEENIIQVGQLSGPFDGFVYAAGIGGLRPLSLTKVENLSEMMNANLFTFIEMVRILFKKRLFNKGGSIVTISSISSIKGLKSKLAYSASKAALDASVRCLAAELADKGIRVNSILKGGLSTDKNIDYIKNVVDFNEDVILSDQLLGEIKPEEVANLAAFLLSDSVKTLTGTGIVLDSGYTL